VASALELELSFMGSLHALDAFAQGDFDAAGFHVPVSGLAAFDRKPFAKTLRARTDRLLRFADREQGLILPRGNPMRVRNFRDVATKGLRFVNRQRGSGTRLLIDQVLADARIEPGRINGYGTEEFTHGAVAATVASGGADVGFGLRAAAADYRLTFLPLVRERYFLAVRASDTRGEPMQRLASALGGPVFQRILRSFAGYIGEGAGSFVSVDAVRGAEPVARGKTADASARGDPVDAD
jgi:molybdate-binding protein